MENFIQLAVQNEVPISSKIKHRRDLLPGISYIPDELEATDDPRVKGKVLAEFVDFIDCITDQLQLVACVTRDHLHSSVPMPFDVIREIRVYPDRPGTRRRLYELNVVKSFSNTQQAIPPTYHNLQQRHALAQRFSRNVSSMDTLLTTITQKNKTRRAQCQERHAASLEHPQDTGGIISKYKKPIWQNVVMDLKRSPIRIPSLEKNVCKAKPEKTEVAKPKQKLIPVFRTKVDELCLQIEFCRAMKVPVSNQTTQNQMDMLSAYFTGFKDVKLYKAHLDSQQPHWFGDLLKLSVHNGMMIHNKVIQAFHRLGRFYDYSGRRDPMGKAKLCFIIQSLPIWDVTRITVQRATEFILREIYKAPDPTKLLVDWLDARELPYVVMPPVLGSFSMAPSEYTKTEKTEAE